MTDRLLTALTATLGGRAVLTHPSDVAPYVVDWRGAHRGAALAVVRPASTAEVVGAVRLCHEAGIAVVPQGGNTGLCGGAVPDGSGSQVVLSLGRMRRVRDVDPVNDTMTVEAGVVLRTVQDAARDVGRLFPLSLGAEGSCTIGGNLATNAGGTGVVRYGMMRDLTLGLEVVLPDGRVWDGLRALRKDNTGYDLKQLFIGAEGTLGIITAAVLKLFPATPRRATAWVALPTLSAAVDAFGLVREHAGERLTAWELMSRPSVDLVLAHVPGTRNPLDSTAPWYGLIELADSQNATDIDDTLERALAQAFDRELLLDAAVASNPPQREALWALRDGISEAQNPAGPSLKHDVSVPISGLADFVARTDQRLRSLLPGIRLITYGHVGDGNLHYNLSKPEGADDAAFTALATTLSAAVNDSVSAAAGSISAEHGLGTAKRDAAAARMDPVELDLMQRLKSALDPAGLMNPEKVLASPPPPVGGQPLLVPSAATDRGLR